MPKRITIGVDIRDLRAAKTGTKTYLEELCKAFEQIKAEDIRFHFLDTSLPVYIGNNKLLKLTEHIKYQFWKQVSLPLKAFFNGCDIVFCTDNFVPLIHLGYQTIPVFHDAFFFETPENYGKLWLWLYKKTAIPAANRSPFVITPSAYSKKQISLYTNIPDDKLVVIAEGPKTLSYHDTVDNVEQILIPHSLTPGNYILHVGSMYKRKNIVNLVHAFDKIKNLNYINLKLVLAGPFTSSKADNDYQLIKNAIDSRQLQNEVVLTGYLTDQELGVLYKNALIYVFPSINEGFGIPVLEAFKFDLPVLVANNTSLPEVGGDAVLMFDPFDINDIFNKIKTVLDDTDLQKEMISKGQQRLKHFSWDETARQLIEVFRDAI